MSISGSDFRLYHSNDLSVLAGILSETLQKDFDSDDFLIPETILIPQPAMKRWLQMVLAEQYGIAANLRFLTPGEFVRAALQTNQKQSVGNIFAADTLRWRVYSVLSDKKQWQHPALQTIAPYLRGTQADMKAWSLAKECAAAFEKYQAWRRDWCLAWDQGAAPLDWQAHVWREVTQGKTHRGQAITDYLDTFEARDAPSPNGLPKRLFVFACLNVSPDVLRVIATAAKAGPLHFFLPSPSRKYWGDVGSLRERLKNRLTDIFEHEENPLLQAWGRAGRDFIATLFSNNTVELRGDVDIYVPNDKDSLLARVKNDLLERQPPSARKGNFDPSDTSLQIHSCHTRLREVQVLHDQLHRLFLNDKEKSLQARDIAIMAPDIDAYAPFIEAVFGAAKNTPRFIPYRLSDRTLSNSSPLTDLFLSLLALPKLELNSNEVLNLLNSPALARYLLVDEDCQRWWPFWIEAAGARWGLNATHRQQHGVPAEHLTTWAFALDRLLLGYASGDNEALKGVAPVPEIEGQSLNTLDKLIRGLRLLARYNEYFRQPHSAGHWAKSCSELLDLLDHPAQTDSNEAAAVQACREAIANLIEQSKEAEFESLIAPEIIRDYFQDVLNENDASQNFLSGGVTVCRMVPMRQIPFKVICLLGLNEGEMPRTEPPGFIQRLSEEIKSPVTRRYGDRSLRDDDRFLFLQLLSAAETSFYLSYCGKHPRDDTEQAPSSLVSELLDCLAAMHPEQTDFRKRFIVQHPLQIFSGEEKPDIRRLRFDPAWQAAEKNTVECAPCFFQTPLPMDGSEQILPWQDFTHFFKNPAKYFLQSRLGLRLVGEEEKLDEHEPFGDATGLARYKLRHTVFNALIANQQMPSNEKLLAYLRSSALLPSGFSAEPVLYKTLSEVKQQAMRFKAWREGEPGVLPFELKLGRFTLQGSLDQVYQNGVARVVLGEMRGRHHCAHGLDALLLSALNCEKPLLEFAELKKDRPIQRIRPTHSNTEARKHLNKLLELFSLGQTEPLPFDAEAGFAYINNLRGQQLSFNEKAWEKACETMPDRDIWWLTAMRGQDPFIDHQDQPDSFPNSVAFREISLTVFAACFPELMHGGEESDD
jgi:exodeoxyribonuclease V gamma subunit